MRFLLFFTSNFFASYPVFCFLSHSKNITLKKSKNWIRGKKTKYKNSKKQKIGNKKHIVENRFYILQNTHISQWNGERKSHFFHDSVKKNAAIQVTQVRICTGLNLFYIPKTRRILKAFMYGKCNGATTFFTDEWQHYKILRSFKTSFTAIKESVGANSHYRINKELILPVYLFILIHAKF